MFLMLFGFWIGNNISIISPPDTMYTMTLVLIPILYSFVFWGEEIVWVVLYQYPVAPSILVLFSGSRKSYFCGSLDFTSSEH